MKLRLTDMAVRKLAYPEGGQITYWDENTPGFGLRCSAKSKSFVVMYGPQRRLKTLGRYPALTLQSARKEARRFLSQITPEPLKTSEVTFVEAVELFLADSERRNRPNTTREYRRYMAFFGFSGRMDEITRTDVMRKLDDLRDRPTSQNYAFTSIKVFFNWALRNELCTNHPIAADKKPNRLQARERVLSDKELGTLFRHTIHNRSLFNDIVSLLILTGQRRSEISELEWSEIDEGFIELGSARTKNRRSHRIPLSKTAQSIIIGREGNDRFLFPSVLPGKSFDGFRRAKARIDAEIGLTHYTLHDLRRTFSSNMARLGTPIHVTEKILNHLSGSFGGVAGVYNRHNYVEEMRAALDAYDDFLCGLMNKA